MATIFTASATNAGFYLQLAVAADSAEQAREAFLASDLMTAPDDEGGDYTLGDDVAGFTLGTTEYDVDDALYYMDADGRPASFDTESVLAAEGMVVMLESGGNG